MPLIGAKGAQSSQGFGQFALSTAANYIEDVFSTFLYTGNGSTQTITNGIDLAGNGGLVWTKARTANAGHCLEDTVRGMTFASASELSSNSTAAAFSVANYMNATATGYQLGTNTNYATINSSGNTYASWTFRKQPKFFDVVTYTGNGSARTVAHNLGSVPGCIIVKRTETIANWRVYHRGLTSASYFVTLNNTDAEGAASTIWNNTAPTSTEFSVGTSTDVNASGSTYVAYLFAHNAGGFGLTGTDNVISCGSFTTDASGNATVNLGYEPQYILYKRSDSTGGWFVIDSMRGWTNGSTDAWLAPNTSAAESTTADLGSPTATGFTSIGLAASASYIYIAIRRGPMKTPTSGTSVFAPVTYTGNGTTNSFTAGFPVDLNYAQRRSSPGSYSYLYDRLRGKNATLQAQDTGAEFNNISVVSNFDNMTGINYTGANLDVNPNQTSATYIGWEFRRAPGFFDEVCYTGNGVAGTTINHNLAAIPELMIFKKRSGIANWNVYSASLGLNKVVRLESTGASINASYFSNTLPTSTIITLGGGDLNNSSATYVAYLFASCPGVSKVTSFTGNGSTQTVGCGFTAGARFVLIKSTSAVGDWYVFDSSRGMTTSTDPWLALNSTAAESSTTGACTTVSSGFAVDESKLTGINTNGVNYIALAIA